MILSALLAVNGGVAVLNLTLFDTTDINKAVAALNVAAVLFILGLMLDNIRSK